jgi:hypothetical protein
MAKRYKIPSSYTAEEWSSLSRREKIQIRREEYFKRSDVQEEQYQAYSREYDKQENKMERLGLKMSTEKLTKEEYLDEAHIVRNQLEYDVEQGRRKGVGNVNQYIVRDQAYEVSYKQAKAQSKYFEQEYLAELREAGLINEKAFERGEVKLNPRGMRELRTGRLQEEFGFYEAVSDYYQRMKTRKYNQAIKMGFTPEQAERYALDEAKNETSKTFFYPDEKKKGKVK